MNTTWLGMIIILVASAITAITVFFDNYIMDVTLKKKSIFLQKIFYAVFHLILLLTLLAFFQIQELDLKSIIFVVISGAAYSLALIPYYFALKKNESTSVEIFSQFEPVVCLLFGLVFFNEGLSLEQYIAFFLILMAGFIVVVFQSDKKAKKTSLKTALLVFAAAALWALADLTFTSIDGDSIDYVSALFYTVLGRAIVDVITALFLKKERKECVKIIKKNGLKKIWPMMADYILEVGSDLIYRIGLLLTPVALGSVVAASSELIFTFIFGILFTFLIPKFGREKITVRNVLIHSVATVILVVGIILIQ